MSRIAVNRLLNIITVIVAGSWTTCSSIRSYDSPKPALITSLDAQLHQEPRIDSTVIKKLRRGTVLYAMAETRSLQEVATVGTDKWLRVKTHSNSEGWCFGKYLEFCTAQKAEVELQRDKLAFEIRLRKLILRAAEEKIRSSSIHPQSVIQSIVITSPLIPPSQSSSYSEADVTASMVGSFFRINKFRIDMKVRLAMQLDPDYLSGSEVSVREVQVTDNRQTEGLMPSETFSLLRLLIKVP